MSARLRAAREQAGLTIGDISASTKIAASALQAIERGDFAKLPGDFYTRAFIRTYARELHLSPDALLEEFDADRHPAQPSHEISQPAQPVRVARRPELAPRLEKPSSSPSLPDPWPQIMAVAGNVGVIALVVVVLVVVIARNRATTARPPEPGAVATTGAAKPAPAPAVTTPPPDAPPDKLVLDIHASAPIWVTASADGTRVLYRLLAPGERVTVQAKNGMSFRIGNAEAFTYSINGAPGKPLGGPGEVREFDISRDNYRTFLR